MTNFRRPFESAPTSDQDHQSDILKVLLARSREVETFDVGPLLGLDGKHEVVFRLPTKEEQDQALAAAHAYAKKRCVDTPEAAADPDILIDAKAGCILAKTMRETANGGEMPVFVNGEILMRHVAPDRIGALTRCLNLTRDKYKPWPTDLSDETVESIVQMCAAGAGGDIPERVLVGCTDVQLSQLVVILAIKLDVARAEAEMLREDLESVRASLAARSANEPEVVPDADPHP